VPAGIIGADIEALLASARTAAQACRPGGEPMANPGLAIGIALGVAASAGRVVARFSADDPVEALPIWIEQLIAESTGKESQGIIPVDGGPLPDSHDDAILISIGAEPDASADIRMRVDEPSDIGAAMFLLEFATAVAGAELGIQPFDQPDVQLAKTLATKAMAGDLPAGGPQPQPITDDLALPSERPLFVSIQAFVAPTEEATRALEDLRAILTGRLDAFVTVGYGPRFLHSTGQLHKGGPAGGWFIQFVDRSRSDLPVPETDYTFGELLAAQAAGDRAALADRDRNVTMIDLGTDVVGSIDRLVGMVAGDDEALPGR
jgi:transaldolase/glucose-6-phosphate isomerase